MKKKKTQGEISVLSNADLKNYVKTNFGPMIYLASRDRLAPLGGEKIDFTECSVFVIRGLFSSNLSILREFSGNSSIESYMAVLISRLIDEFISSNAHFSKKSEGINPLLNNEHLDQISPGYINEIEEVVSRETDSLSLDETMVLFLRTVTTKHFKDMDSFFKKNTSEASFKKIMKKVYDASMPEISKISKKFQAGA